MSEHTAIVTDATFEAEVLQASVPVLVDFWAPWCGPCRALAPTLDTLAQELAGMVKVVKLNVDESPTTAAAYNIRSIPTLLLFKNGQLVATKIGAATKLQLAEFVNTNK